MTMHAPATFRIARPVPDEREQDRVPLHLPILVVQPGRDDAPAELSDISERGCRIAAALRVKAGRYVGIEIPGLGRFAGWIAWQTRREFGLDFATPITADEVRRVAELAMGGGGPAA